MNSNLLGGFIPVELENCISLTILDLGKNQLNGSILEGLADLEQLQCLVLSYNNLSGPIPAKPSKYFRQISIPDSSFILGKNRLTGALPESLGQLSNLVKLNLTGNKLSGSIPSALKYLNGLTHVDLSFFREFKGFVYLVSASAKLCSSPL